MRLKTYISLLIALKVVLKMFTGPLDLLLYLIKKHDIDILDLPVASLTEQYMIYLEEMKQSHFILAAQDCLAYAGNRESLAQHFLAMPTLVNQSRIDMMQDDAGGSIYLLPLDESMSIPRGEVVYG